MYSLHTEHLDASVITKILFLALLTLMTTRTKAQETAAGALRSYTLVHALPGDFRDAETENLEPAELAEGAFKAVSRSSKPVTAVLTSPQIKALFPFDRLLLTANAALGPGDSLSFQAQVKADGDWSPWFDFGSFNPAGGAASAGSQENPFGRMAIDTVVLKARAKYLRYRIRLSAAAGSAPALRLVSAVCTDSSLPYNEAAAVKKAAGGGALRLAVPQYSQMLEQVNYSKDICSPTSLAMALNYFGVKSAPLETAARVFDTAENIYGNWSFNAAFAGARGLYAWLTRLNSLDEAREHLDAGILLVASLTYGPEELKRSPLRKTAGHLLVIKGFDAKGNVITNDPAAPDGKTVERVYDRREFAQAWLKNKFGTAYAVTPAVKDLLTARPPFAEMFSMPLDSGKGGREKLIETQVLPGERARLLEARGAWLNIEALEQPRKDGKGLAPYRGWIEAKDAVFAVPGRPDAVVKAKKAALGGGAQGELSVGVKVKLAAGEKGRPLALLPGGEGGLISEKDINRLPVKLPPEELRKKILETARKFLGDKYYWGGRSASGVDCSGLVSLAYRAWGVDLPRNASDQFTAARSVARENLQPADLIFSTAPADNASIDHVMLYAGNGRLIEATRDTDSVREVSFKEKFGIEFDKAKNGQAIKGKKVYFRRILK